MVLFWSAIIVQGSIAAAFYVGNVLQTTLLTYLECCPGVSFLQDHACLNIARRTADSLQEVGIDVLPRPRRSPDLNAIDGVRLPHSQKLLQLKIMLQ